MWHNVDSAVSLIRYAVHCGVSHTIPPTGHAVHCGVPGSVRGSTAAPLVRSAAGRLEAANCSLHSAGGARQRCSAAVRWVQGMLVAVIH